jgi:hypothetical protein
MPRMIDLIRQSAVPVSVLRTAARGALSLPASEMLEILVQLTSHPLFGEQAQHTLAAWDETSALAVLSDPACSPQVLDYFLAPENQRPALLPALIDNPAAPEARLMELARTASGGVLSAMLVSPRVVKSLAVLQAMLANPALTAAQIGQVNACRQRLAIAETEAASRDVVEPELSRYLGEHATEIAAAERESFHLIGWTPEEQLEIASGRPLKGLDPSSAAAFALGAAARAESRQRTSPIQRIARMTVGERVQLALKGTKEDRSILIRDGARVVSSAVLESPKVTESEIEMFAAMKNVGENVLRGIAGKRKFMRSYALKRILTANPRCPLDVALPLVKELLVLDLKNLSMNKNVSDTVRRFAYKMWKEKANAK